MLQRGNSHLRVASTHGSEAAIFIALFGISPVDSKDPLRMGIAPVFDRKQVGQK